MGEELAAPTISALYLIANQDGAMLFAGFCQTLRKRLRDHHAAAYTLYAFYDAGAHITLGQFLLPGIEVV